MLDINRPVHYSIEGFNSEHLSTTGPRPEHYLNENACVLGALEITANVYCNGVHLYWEGCVICSVYLQ